MDQLADLTKARNIYIEYLINLCFIFSDPDCTNCLLSISEVYLLEHREEQIPISMLF